MQGIYISGTKRQVVVYDGSTKISDGARCAPLRIPVAQPHALLHKIACTSSAVSLPRCVIARQFALYKTIRGGV